MEAEMMNKFQEIYAMLEDEESKDIYLNRLNYLISGDFRYMKYIIDKYVQTTGNMTVEEWIASLPSEKSIVLYGAGNDARICLPYFEKDPRFIGFCDRDEEKQKSGVAGYKVFQPEYLYHSDDTIVISSHIFKDEIKKSLMEMGGVLEERIFCLHPEMYDFKEGQYFNPDFMSFEEEEVFVDAGAYNLATTTELQNYCKKIKKVYAFEPDPENSKNCKNIMKRLNFEINVIPCGTWSERKTLHFNALNNSDSKIAETGETCIEVMPIDEAVDPSQRVTYIKMDVEGSELESLKGAKRTILKDRPKLAICIYHKPEDMLTLPLYIKSLVPEYKLYLRHHSGTESETVLYAMP